MNDASWVIVQVEKEETKEVSLPEHPLLGDLVNIYAEDPTFISLGDLGAYFGEDLIEGGFYLTKGSSVSLIYSKTRWDFGQMIGSIFVQYRSRRPLSRWEAIKRAILGDRLYE